MKLVIQKVSHAGVEIENGGMAEIQKRISGAGRYW